MQPTNGSEKLERALVRVGKSIDYPATPALAARVLTELEVRPRRVPARRWMLTALAAIVIAVALLVAFPAARDTLAQILSLRTIRIISITPTPTATVTPSGTIPSQSTPTVTPTAKPFAQCCETTLEDASAHARFRILLPPTELPTRVYSQNLPDFGDAQQVILVFGEPSAPRLTLYEATDFLYGKMVSGSTIIEETQVNGQRALWLSGAPHLLVYLDANGQPQFETERMVNANTLAWEADNVTFRLETSASKDEAIRFAESLR